MGGVRQGGPGCAARSGAQIGPRATESRWDLEQGSSMVMSAWAGRACRGRSAGSDRNRAQGGLRSCSGAMAAAASSNVRVQALSGRQPLMLLELSPAGASYGLGPVRSRPCVPLGTQ